MGLRVPLLGGTDVGGDLVFEEADSVVVKCGCEVAVGLLGVIAEIDPHHLQRQGVAV